MLQVPFLDEDDLDDRIKELKMAEIKRGALLPPFLLLLVRAFGFRDDPCLDGDLAATDLTFYLTTIDGAWLATWAYGWEPAARSRPPVTPAQVLPFVRPILEMPRSVWPGTYAEYLASPRWQKVAADARKEWRRLGVHCLMSDRHEGPVEMHHRAYRGVPFAEDWQDLIPLCEECHGLYHGRLPKPDRGLFDEPDQIKRAA